MPNPPPGVTILEHPLLADKLARLRAAETSPAAFAALARQIAALMAWPATSTLATREQAITTPMEPMTARVLARPIALVPILRAGLAMLDGVRDLLPEARVGHIGLYRDHDTLRAIPYYFKVPEPIADHDVLVLDPMLATGGSAVEALRELKAAGAVRLTFCCLVAAPEGIARLHAEHPDVPIVAAALDRELNANGYILPGLGDAGDRTFGTT